MDLFAAEIGMDPAEVRRRNFLPPDAFPYDNPSGLGTAGGAKIYIDSGNYEPALDKALAMVGYDGIGAAKAEARTRGKYLGVGLSTYIEVCGVAPTKWIGAVGEGWGAAMWESANIKMHLTGKTVVTMGTSAAGPGPRDDLRADRRPRARHPDGGHRRPALGHAGDAVRLRLVRQPDLVGRQHGRHQGGRQDPREGAPDGRPHARGVRRRHRGRRRELLRVKGSPDRVKTIQEIAFAIDLGFDPPEGMEPYLDETAYYDTPNCTWPFGTHIAIVEIDEETGARRARALRRRRRRRQEDQPDDRRRPAPRRHRPGRRPGALGGRHLRRPGPAADRLDAGLRAAARLVLPEPRARRDGHAVAGQPARRQGRRRGRRDREHGRGGQRRHRRAQSARHPPSRHAVHAQTVWRAIQGAKGGQA